MLGHTLLHQKWVVVIGDWPHGDGHLVLINAKCSAQAHGGGASVLEVDEKAFACRRRAFSDSSLERAVGAMGLGLTYEGIEPILKVEWMPKICQALRCLTTEPKPVRQPSRTCTSLPSRWSSWSVSQEIVLALCKFACNHWDVPVHTVPSFVGHQMPHGWAAGGCIEVMVIPGFGWVAHMVVVLCAPGCRGVWSSASWTGGLLRMCW